MISMNSYRANHHQSELVNPEDTHLNVFSLLTCEASMACGCRLTDAHPPFHSLSVVLTLRWRGLMTWKQ